MAFFKPIFAKRQPAPKELDIVTISEIHELLAPRVSNALGSLGFENRGPLAWVRSTDAPIRQMFELKQWKGGKLAPSWGLSLDFVPHVSGSSVKWHRTPKSAMLDFRVDGRRRESDMSFIWGPSRLLDDAPAALEAALPRAKEWWALVASVNDLPSAFERLKEYYAQGGGLGFYNFTQHPIAFAFSLAKTGRTDEARDEFEKHLNPSWPSEVEERLRQLLSSTVAEM
jgi:hypothetical protein